MTTLLLAFLLLLPLILASDAPSFQANLHKDRALYREEEREFIKAYRNLPDVQPLSLTNENEDEEALSSSSRTIYYRVIENGPLTGRIPLVSSPTVLEYSGRVVGTDSLFDSGVNTFVPSSSIPGWKQALQLMREGDEWELLIPPALAYGAATDMELIPPNSWLLFTIKIHQVQGRALNDDQDL